MRQKSGLTEILEKLEKEELVKLVLDLSKLRKDNAAWIATKYQNMSKTNNQVAIEHYKKRIISGFFTPRGSPRRKYSEAKRAISDFKKASDDKKMLIDIMILYVEKGTEYLSYDDRNEPLYTSLENTFDNAIKYLLELNDSTIIEEFKPRIETIIKNAHCLGYDYDDSLREMYEKLETR